MPGHRTATPNGILPQNQPRIGPARAAGLKACYSGGPGRRVRPRRGFACREAENLLFSGAHLHATLPQATGRTRFSLDFRIVDLADHAAGLGAPEADNRSRGSSLPDYVQPPAAGAITAPR